ncbi:hypothetical protein B0A50_06327 [Salinomyces thailandicus]|uniref:Fork-head domain-containing protein n=1 Tax=Salinomyces thailandicus TaxID=706561 RepID=A0A4U0TTD2_9PEZI|nr:hypothetical protein B0A50_06327 [Salinomyces thailandica]
MEVHPGFWQQAFDPMTATSTSRGRNMSATHHPSRRSQGSSPEDVEWQNIFEELEAGSKDYAPEFNPYSPPSTTAGALQQSPVQSIETADAKFPEQDAMLPYGCDSSSFPYVINEPHQHIWPPSGAPSYPPSIPEHEQWAPSEFALGTPQTSHPGSITFGQAAYQPPPAHHLIAGESPLLSEGSPLHQGGFVDGDWCQADGLPVFYERSGSDELLDDTENSDPCYAQLLHRCLKEAPDHTMSLRELYDWVREHSQKAKDPKNRGWQNSVRHNLSMNAAFERVPPNQTHGVKKGSLWRLTPSALNNGVISTTRYRKDPKRKPERRASPALKRQLSGAKGGQATRNATRRQQALREARSHPNLFARHRHLHHSPDIHNLSPVPFRSSHPNTPQPFIPLQSNFQDHQKANYQDHQNQPQPHQHQPAPSSPYFLDLSPTHPTSLTPTTTSAPRTPQTQTQIHLHQDLHEHFHQQPKSALADFNFGHIDFTNANMNGGTGGGGLIGEQDDFALDTPTEASFMSEEGVAELLGHNSGSREGSGF